MKGLLIMGILLLPWLSLSAQSLSVDPQDLEIDGLLIDQTRSRMGREFYEYFYQQWSPPPGISDYTILIEEKPPRGRSASVSIKVNDRLIATHALQARQITIITAAQAAIARTAQYLLRNSQLQKDLDAGDQAGSGIF